LKIIEGTVASVQPQEGRKHPHQEFWKVDRKIIFFIGGVAFNGLEKIIEQRISSRPWGLKRSCIHVTTNP